jgi:hypothetical protein
MLIHGFIGASRVNEWSGRPCGSFLPRMLARLPVLLESSEPSVYRR